MDRYRLIAVNERQAQMIADTFAITSDDPDICDLAAKAMGVAVEYAALGHVNEAVQIIEMSKKDMKRMERQMRKEDKRAKKGQH